ncbi:D-alanyl-D-alanine carboxypeptidase family protein [Luteimonas pelagia]
MRPAPRHRRHLLNTTDIEVWPGGLLRARNSHDDRLLARARHVLRRKRDGRYLAADTDEGLVPMVQGLAGEPGLAQARHALAHRVHRRAGVEHVGTLPLGQLASRLASLGLDADAYADRTGLPLVPEPDWLQSAGRDRYARPLWLHVDAAAAWARMRVHALRDGVVLEAISGYRSHDYQLGIFERKRARGLSVDDILSVNAAPGFSEHHSGRALDIGTPGEPPAEESFEATPAFAWLSRHARGHGFAMSYPRDNPHGIVYEPWHWMHGADATG